jgi:hypothetical protein
MSIEVMKQAREMIRAQDMQHWGYQHDDVTIAALSQAITEAEQAQPVAWKDKTYGNLHHHDYGNSIPLYTAPPQRQSLTDDRVWLEYMQLWPFRPNEEPTLAKDILRFARAIEAAHGIKGEA